MFNQKTRLALLALTTVAFALPAENVTAKPRKLGKRCTGTISSAASVAAAVECTTIVIDAFTMTEGVTLEIDAPDGASITMAGDISFPYYQWAGPLMIVKGDSVTFNGAGYSLKGNGDQYWDGEGTGGGKTKPAPLLRINHSGTFKDTIIKNAPARGVAIGGASIVVDTVTVDNADGDALGANTDGFDISSDGPVTVQNSKVHGQDDCLAINRGSDITFTGNTCTGPTHGISIGSITSSTTVSNVIISKNTVTGAVNGLRIKTDAVATSSTVNGVTYTGNVLTGITKYGVLIDQSYPSTLGTPGTGVVIEKVVFSGTNTIAVGSSAYRLEINCGSTTSCPGTWNLAGLDITGGKAGVVKNVAVTGGTY
ncbi:glycoside hydrolase family 28 protein [Athelia psychrophila]|uniref:endo-polygalacturonase n=2 Tax=Athelia psychrophila TaxID=1759441 RepID=A0A166BA62_9AGAM|nr:glycoside hydrolase family 28 protein [Fibularhizoctonia sp. CBS 109695]